jgi:HK97 gp10 family phage protein
MELECSVDTSQFEQNLTKFGAKVASVILAKALRAGGNVLAEAQREAAPERTDGVRGGDALPPGALKNDIQVQIDIDGSRQVGLVKVGPGLGTGHVALWLEGGHEMVSHGKKRNRKFIGKGRVEPHPFIGPAFQASAQHAVETVIDLIADGINEELVASGDLIAEGLS